jgi:hypothetical protein
LIVGWTAFVFDPDLLALAEGTLRASTVSVGGILLR